MFYLFSDGGSRGNPGQGACAYLLYDEVKPIYFDSKGLGRVTNNEAEYEGLIIGLIKANKLGIKEIVCRLDSELVVKQMNGEYRVKEPNISVLHKKVLTLKQKFDLITFEHIEREINWLADRLVNIVLNCKEGY